MPYLIQFLTYVYEKENLIMIDFKTELKKYQPLLELDEIEEAIQSDEVSDIIDLLQHMSEISKKRS